MHFNATVFNRRQISRNAGSDPEMRDMHYQEKEQQRAQQTHGAAVPFAAFIAQCYGIALLSFAPVLHFHHPALYDMDDEADEQHYFHQSHHYCRAHEMRGPVEHGAIIISPDAGIQAYVNNKETDEEQAGQGHYEFLTNGRCEECGPFHVIIGFFIPTKGTYAFFKAAQK